MANFYEDNADLQFNLEHFVDWDSFVPQWELDFADAKKYQENQDNRYEYAPSNTEEAVEGYRSVWEAYATIIDGELAPHIADIDRQGVKLQDGKVLVPAAQENFINTLRDTGVLCFGVGRDFGSLNFGLCARMPINEMMSRADASTGIIVSYYNMAEMIEWFGDEEMKEKYLPKFVNGQMLGAMALTEPNYGSDLTQAQTRAVKKDGREFELTGSKIFITQACGFGENTDAAIFTIARSLDKKGAFGLSFFLVETEDVQVSRLEEKIGLHSSATCEIQLDKSRGQLIGEEGAGLVRYAIAMMNGARMGIACQSLGIAQQALSLAKEYASQRVQFGETIDKLPAVNRLLDESEARLQGTRALIYRAAEIVDRGIARSAYLEHQGKTDREARKDPEVVRWEKLAKFFTPLSKFTASEFCCKIAYDALQVHGGVGYTEEYQIAKVYRDARITSIYEGTTQLQVVAAIGTIVEGSSPKSILYQYVQEQLQELDDADLRQRLQKWWEQLVEAVAAYKDLEKEERETVALELVWHAAHTLSALLLGIQEKVAREQQHPILESKQAALATYLRLAEAQIGGGLAYLHTYTSK